MLRTTTPPLHIYKRTANRLGWALVLFVPLFYCFTGSVEGLFSLLPTHNAFIRLAYGALTTLAYIAPFMIAGLFYYLLARQDRGLRRTTRGISLRPRMIALMPFLILAGLALNLLVAGGNAIFCEWIGYTIPEDMVVIEGYDDPGAVILYMTTAIAPAFAEEFLFRGVIYANLRPYGRWQAILISALTFALMHENIGQLFYTFVAGIVMALMYEYTGSIWCGLIFHLLNNELSGIGEILVYGRYGDAALAYLELWNIAVLVLGVISLLILVVYALSVCRQKKRNNAGSRTSGLTTFIGIPTAYVEQWDAPVPPSTAATAFLTPGLMAYVIIEFSAIVLDYILVIFANLGGGLL